MEKWSSFGIGRMGHSLHKTVGGADKAVRAHIEKHNSGIREIDHREHETVYVCNDGSVICSDVWVVGG